MTDRIILIGYMGAGKTTVGRALARALHMPFYDLDWYIEQRMHRSVRQIFDERGEEGFRNVERNMLHEVAEFNRVVLSCGGGTPCFFDNIDYLNRQGATVYLKATPDVLFSHLHMGRNVRPLLLGKTPDEVRHFISEQLAEREDFYTKAHYTVDISLLDNHKKVQDTILRLCETLGISTDNINTNNNRNKTIKKTF